MEILCKELASDKTSERGEKEAIANKQIMPEAPEMQLWDDLEPKVPTANATS